jgi:aspartyl-tRNA(Asn)/glutamyl-tRNA(Gln) amidotransferase subunit A
MSIEQAARELRARRVSSLELTEAALKKAADEQPRTNAFITITADLAREQARRADDELARGIDRGPLHGIPYGLKDCFATKGIRTTCGSRIFFNHVPDHDAAVYEKLTAAGAVLIGKNGMQEFAYGITCNNPHFGAIRNPRDPSRIPGGSSGGSAAAVAAGTIFFSLGTDTGGSIRLPAAYCGCVGLKPTSGRVSRRGVMPLDFSMDHIGPITRTSRDAALVMNAIAVHDPHDDTSSLHPGEDYLPAETSLRGKRIGVPENFYSHRIAPEVASAYRGALDRASSLGARLVPIQLPDPAEVNVISRMILLVEAAALLEPYVHRRDDFGADVITLLDQGRLIRATDYVNAQRVRRVLQREWSAIWRDIDFLFTPTAPIPAPKIGDSHVDISGISEDVRLASTRLLRAMNILGYPALSVPMTGTELPAGLQIIGKPFAERAVLTAGAILE